MTNSALAAPDQRRILERKSVMGDAAMPTTTVRLRAAIGALSCGWLVVFAVGDILVVTTSIPVGLIGGLVERGLAVTELAGAGLLGVWLWHGCCCCRQ